MPTEAHNPELQSFDASQFDSFLQNLEDNPELYAQHTAENKERCLIVARSGSAEQLERLLGVNDSKGEPFVVNKISLLEALKATFFSGDKELQRNVACVMGIVAATTIAAFWLYMGINEISKEINQFAHGQPLNFNTTTTLAVINTTLATPIAHALAFAASVAAASLFASGAVIMAKISNMGHFKQYGRMIRNSFEKDTNSCSIMDIAQEVVDRGDPNVFKTFLEDASLRFFHLQTPSTAASNAQINDDQIGFSVYSRIIAGMIEKHGGENHGRLFRVADEMWRNEDFGPFTRLIAENFDPERVRRVSARIVPVLGHQPAAPQNQGDCIAREGNNGQAAPIPEGLFPVRVDAVVEEERGAGAFEFNLDDQPSSSTSSPRTRTPLSPSVREAIR